ncbi:MULTISPECIES: hypothetical protein [unclassified Crossiella]|nr:MULTISPECIES: hypothetical protein [unclassified Crossiella]
MTRWSPAALRTAVRGRNHGARRPAGTVPALEFMAWVPRGLRAL